MTANRLDLRRNSSTESDHKPVPGQPNDNYAVVALPKLGSETVKRMAALTGVAVVIVGTLMWLHDAKASYNPIPADVRAAVQYPLYYPSADPTGFHTTSPDINNPDNSVLLTLSNDSNSQTISIAQEARPKTFDPQVMFDHNPYPTSITPLGTLYDLTYKNQYRYMLDTQKSIILIGSTNMQLTNSEVMHIINGLKSAN